MALISPGRPAPLEIRCIGDIQGAGNVLDFAPSKGSLRSFPSRSDWPQGCHPVCLLCTEYEAWDEESELSLYYIIIIIIIIIIFPR